MLYISYLSEDEEEEFYDREDMSDEDEQEEDYVDESDGDIECKLVIPYLWLEHDEFCSYAV